MRRFKNILLALKEKDIDSSQVVSQAVGLAVANEAKFSVITVYNEMPPTVESFLHKTYGLDLDNQVIEKTQNDIRDHVARYNEKLAEKTEIAVSFGEPWVEVIRHVLKNKNDLVIISGTEQKSLMKRIFGSTTMKLMRKCPAAVWVMNPPTSERAETGVLSAIDNKHGADHVDEINDKVISLGASIANNAGVKLHMLQAWRHFGEDVQRGHWGLQENELKELLQQEEAEHEKNLAACVQRNKISGVEYETHLVKGDAGRIIADFIKDNHISLLVMGTVCRTGVSGFVIGNTAEKILRKVTCSVLAVKPRDFVSPITLDS